MLIFDKSDTQQQLCEIAKIVVQSTEVQWGQNKVENLLG